jgi:putative regulator of septum formation
MTSSPAPGYRFVCPPSWPQPPLGWTPPADWLPDPAWGPAPPGWSFWQPEVPTGIRPPVDGFAVTALITGLFGAFLFSGIFGFVSLGRIRRGERRGRGLVFTGWALCAIWLICGVGYAAMQIGLQPQRAPSGTITASGKVAPMELRNGDCVKVPVDRAEGSVILSLDVVPCAQPHNAQVFDTITLDGDAYPGESATTQLALEACEPKAYDYLGDNEVDGLRLLTFAPPEAGWKKGERAARCLLYDDTNDFTGEVRDHG